MSDGQKGNLINEILKELTGSVLTTLEIERKMEQKNVRCPDDIARILSQMRKKGIISGKLSAEKGAWVWWVDE